MVTPAEIKELVPQIDLTGGGRYPVLGASFHVPAATARHDRVAWAYASGASQAGVDIHQHTAVTGLVHQGDRVVGVETANGTIGAGQVLSATGGRVTAMAALAGVRLSRCGWRTCASRPPTRRCKPRWCGRSRTRRCAFPMTRSRPGWSCCGRPPGRPAGRVWPETWSAHLPGVRRQPMDVVAQLVDHVRDALAANGDLAMVEHQLAELARRGTGAAEQVSWRKDGADDAAVVRHAVQRTLGQPA